MARRNTYSSVERICLNNSEIRVECSFNPLNRDNFFHRVGVTNQTQRGTDRMNEIYRNGTLFLENMNAEVYVPHGIETSFQATNNSKASGYYFGGILDVDSSSTLKMRTPRSFVKKLGPVGAAIAGTVEDLSYMAAITLPIAAMGVPLVKFFGGQPMDFLDECILLSAGTYIGIRGDIKRSFLLSLGIAVTTTFGPEIKEMVVKGLESGVGNLGCEDIAKSSLYCLMWGGGKLMRDYFAEKTKRF